MSGPFQQQRRDQRVRSFSPAPERGPASHAATSSKLRDSCHACACSKVRCSKDKPICTRCKKRGTSCDYLHSRRPGRKQEKRGNSDQATSNIKSSHPTEEPANEVRRVSTDISLPTTDEEQSLINSVIPASSSTDTDLDDFLASPLAFTFQDVPEMSNFGVLFHPQHCSDSNISSPSSRHSISSYTSQASSVSSIPPEELIYLFGSQPPSPPQVAPDFKNLFPTNDEPIHQILGNTASGCSCTMQALDLMKRICSHESSQCLLADNRQSTIRLTSLDMITMNQDTIDSMSRMLHCCSTDSFLLAIVPLIVCKVLSLYHLAATSNAALVSSPQNGQQQQPNFNHDDDRDEPRRRSAQLVLGELHRVQRFLTQLSTSLQMFKQHTSPTAQTGMGSSTFGDHYAGSDSPFSTKALENIESDLRQRVRALSLKIIDTLRQD